MTIVTRTSTTTTVTESVACEFGRAECNACRNGGEDQGELESVTLRFQKHFTTLHAQSDGGVGLHSTLAEQRHDTTVDLVVVDAVTGNILHLVAGAQDGVRFTLTRGTLGGLPFTGRVVVSMLDPQGGSAAAAPLPAPNAPSHCYGLACAVIDLSCSQPLRTGDGFGFVAVAGVESSAGLHPDMCPCNVAATLPPASDLPVCTSGGDPHDCGFLVGAFGCSDAVASSCQRTCGACVESTTTASPTEAPTTKPQARCAAGVPDPAECSVVLQAFGCGSTTNFTCPVSCGSCAQSAAPDGGGVGGVGGVAGTALPTLPPDVLTECARQDEGCTPCGGSSTPSSLTELLVRYSADFASRNEQDGGLPGVAGVAVGAPVVHVAVTEPDGAAVHLESNLGEGQTFSITADPAVGALPRWITLTLHAAAGGEDTAAPAPAPAAGCPAGAACVTIDTSCAQPLRVGDAFGNVVVAGYETSDGRGTADCMCLPPPVIGVPAANACDSLPADPAECYLVVGMLGCIELTNRTCPVSCGACAPALPTTTAAPAATTPASNDASSSSAALDDDTVITVAVAGGAVLCVALVVIAVTSAMFARSAPAAAASGVAVTITSDGAGETPEPFSMMWGPRPPDLPAQGWPGLPGPSTDADGSHIYSSVGSMHWDDASHTA